MLYLLMAIVSSASLVIILKLFELKGVNMYAGITVNYVVGAVLSFVITRGDISAGYIFSSPWLWSAIVLGVMFCLSFVVFAFSAQKSGVAITAISARAAVVIPVAFAFAFLDAEITTLKIAMLVLVLISMGLIMYKGKTGGKAKVERKMWVLLLPLTVFLFNGANDTVVQYAQNVLVPPGEYATFLGSMFGFAAVTGLLCIIGDSIRNPHSPNGKDLAWGSLLGFLNWTCMIGVFYGLDYLDGSLFFPIYYTGVIVIATLAGVWAFREKLTRLNFIGIGIAVVAIAVLSTQ